MKKIILTLALILGISAAQAQVTLEGSKFTDNWSFTLKGGAISPFQHYAVFKNARGVFGAELRKQITPVFGLGVEGEWTVNTSSWNKPVSYVWGAHSNTIIDHQMVGMFGAFNLSNLFGGYAGAPRFFEVEALMGAGWLHGYKAGDNDDNSWYTKAGMNFNFNLGESKAWTISIKPSVLWDMNGDFDKYNRKVTDAAGNVLGNYPNKQGSRFNANHAAIELEAGLTYHFGNSNGTHYFTICPKQYTQADLDAVNSQVNALRNQLNNAQADLDAANARNAQLQKDLDACNSKKPEVVTVDKSKESMRILVHYKVNKTNVSADQQPNVERVASYLKNHPDATVTIRGYASPEGPADNNIRLANERAESVKNMLVKKYGIKASRIDAKGNGISDMFEELSWNRVSICDIVVNDNK